MRIAQVAPLHESVPPKNYGGTERVVSYLTEELVRQGHDVTLFASGDSVTKAKLVAIIENSLRLDPSCRDPTVYHTMLLDQVIDSASFFDVIHFHTDYLHFPLARRAKTPHLTTVHGRLDLPDLIPLYKRFHNIPLVSISDSQRLPLAGASWQGTVHHGLPPDLYSFNPDTGDYFAFLGRLSPEKRVDRAIEIAVHCGVPLIIAAKVDKADELYFEDQIKPLLNHPLIKFIGEIGEQEKSNFLGRAKALLFPIDWPEPFGLVQIEAFACGTPVIAYDNGSVGEIMEHGVTGFVVKNQQEAFQAARNIESIDRKRCRSVFERRFCAERMAKNYLHLYKQVVCGEEVSEQITI